MRARIRRRLIHQWVSVTSGAAPTLDSINFAALPARLTQPLRRHGLDPVALARSDDDGEAVHRIGRVLGFSVWLVTGHHLTRAMLNDSSFSTNIRSLMGGGHESTIGGLGFTDPPDHTAMRKILAPEFTARRLSALRPTVERIVKERLDAMETAGPVVDMVAEFAFPVPFQVISELLGLPAEDRKRFQGLGDDRFDVTRGGAGMFDAISQSRNFVRDAVRQQRTAPGTGLIAGMLRTHGDDVDDEVIAGLADGVFTGGYETSASMLALGVLVLMRDPDTLLRIREDPQVVDGVVDELIRYLSVVQIAFPRFARRDLILSGQRVREGDVVLCSLTRANRDAAVGEAPDRFDPSRPPAPHVAFGYGFHRCIGAELARMQLRIAFRALAQRFPQMTLAVPATDLRFHELSIVYGLKALPVHLHGIADAGAVTTSPGSGPQR